MKLEVVDTFLMRLVRSGSANCYLVREPDGFTLVDTGLPGGAAEILRVAREAGGEIRRIALTHAHLDHAGEVDALAHLLPEAEIVVSRREARLLAGDFSLDHGEPSTRIRGRFSTVRSRPTRLIEPGETVGSLRACAAEGHTPGHLAFFDQRNGALLAGDSWRTKGGLSISGPFNIFAPFSAFSTWHKPSAIASARRLRNLEPLLLAPGHGPVLHHPLGPMDRILRPTFRSY